MTGAGVGSFNGFGPGGGGIIETCIWIAFGIFIALLIWVEVKS